MVIQCMQDEILNVSGDIYMCIWVWAFFLDTKLKKAEETQVSEWCLVALKHLFTPFINALG